MYHNFLNIANNIVKFFARDEIDLEDYIIESEMENECNNETRG